MQPDSFHCDLINTTSMGEGMYGHSHPEPRFVVTAIEHVTIRQVTLMVGEGK